MMPNTIENVFKRYDIRGKYPEEINPRFAYRLGRVVGTMGNIVLGGDNRKSTPKLKENFVKGVLDSGSDIVDVGLCTSDLLSFSAKCEKKIGCGIF